MTITFCIQVQIMTGLSIYSLDQMSRWLMMSKTCWSYEKIHRHVDLRLAHKGGGGQADVGQRTS